MLEDGLVADYSLQQRAHPRAKGRMSYQAIFLLIPHIDSPPQNPDTLLCADLKSACGAR